jgi:uncharacterized protein (TIGR00266 family)
MDSKIIGTTMPVLEVGLDPGESVVAEGGELSWMTDTIDMHTGANKAGGGGVFGNLKRKMTGGTIFMTEYTAQGARGMVAFATKVPGHIMPLQLDGSREYMVQKHGFMCGVPSVNLEVGFQQKFSAGYWGGAGFMLQRLTGTGDAWIALSGETVKYDLPAGEVMKVNPGHVAMFEGTVSFEIERVKGIKNWMFGADTFFLAKLTGPGTIFLQTMPLPILAATLAPYLEREGEARSTSNSGSSFNLGGAIGGLLSDS